MLTYSHPCPYCGDAFMVDRSGVDAAGMERHVTMALRRHFREEHADKMTLRTLWRSLFGLIRSKMS